MKQIALYPLLLALCLSLCTCKKEEQELPPITSRGANTFGCYLDGRPIVFTNPKQISYGLIGDYDTLGQLLPIDSFDMWLVFDDGKNSINLFLNNAWNKNKWELDQNTLIHPVVNRPLDYIKVNSFISSANTKGIFNSNILKNSNSIFWGTFEFECINPKTCQTMKVTNGRIDVNLWDLQ